MDAATTALRALADEGRAGLVMDFDGVLSHITADPSESQLLPGVRELLGSLAKRLAVVALLSGRPAGFLAERATIPGVELYGSYGVERVGDAGDIEVLPEALRWRTALAEATHILRQELAEVEGVHIEEKSVAVAVHWRRAPDRDAAESLVAPTLTTVRETFGLRREPGKFVEELRMPLARDKGTTLRDIVEAHGLRTVAYAGDDRGDLPAFAVATVRGHALVVDGPDMPREVADVAGAHFTSPAEFVAWLERLDDALERNPRSTRAE